MTTNGRLGLGVVFCLAALIVPASAATIKSVSTFSLPGFSTGSAGPFGNTPAPNNDDADGANPKELPTWVFLNSPGNLETEFVLENSGGTTEYRFTQSFLNTRSAPWTGFRFELGYGLGNQFVSSGPAELLRFDQANGHSTASSPTFTLKLDSLNRLEWSIPNVPFGAAFTFAIDVPDGVANMNPSGLNRFNLR